MRVLPDRDPDTCPANPAVLELVFASSFITCSENREGNDLNNSPVFLENSCRICEVQWSMMDGVICHTYLFTMVATLQIISSEFYFLLNGFTFYYDHYSYS